MTKMSIQLGDVTSRGAWHLWRHTGACQRDVTRDVALLPRSLACPDDDVVASLELNRLLLDISWRSWRWNWRRNRQ